MSFLDFILFVAIMPSTIITGFMALCVAVTFFYRDEASSPKPREDEGSFS
ncbi:MAG: hypothetical protein AAB429_02630 [Patescibacteria group bacterium]